MAFIKRNLWIRAVGLLAVGCLMFGGDYSIYQLLQQNYQIRKLASEVREQEEITIRLRNQIRLLKTDSGYLERIAREQYRMAKPGEHVYLIQPKIVR